VDSQLKHINYNANDIERYLKGQMSKTEMHTFELAMMNDAMLSDAVDGYSQAMNQTNAKADLSEIAERLKAAPAKVVQGSFKQWISIAAALVILLSLSVVMYRIFYHDKKNGDAIAVTDTKKETTPPTATETIVDSTTVAIQEPNLKADEKTLPEPVVIPPAQTPKPSTAFKTETKDNASAGNEAVASAKKPSAPANSAPVAANDNTVIKEMHQHENVVNNQKAEQVKLNKFVGRVVDEHNNPLPFANVTEKNSGVGTYADANGNFVLLSADSALNVQTKSFGFLNSSTIIKSNGVQNIMLKEEAVLANAPSQEVLYDRSKKRLQKENADTADEVFALPADGWGKFNLYVLNNQRNPNDDETEIIAKQKRSREVQLSFDVNPDGTLSNIKVERSNCRDCNNEAIRLLKEGPRWKSKTGKKETAKFTVRF
jgi:outer membrane biosynthesis protein TonB